MADVASLICPSWSGKTTVLRTLAVFDKPTAGTVSIHGKSGDIRFGALNIGVAFQDSALLEWRSVRRNIALPLELAGRAPDPDRSTELIHLGGVEGGQKGPPSQLEGGM